MLKILQIYLKTKWAYVSLAALMGVALATVLVQVLSSERVLALAFSDWQITLIYGFCIAGSVLFTLRGKQSGKVKTDGATNIGETAEAQAK